MSQKILLAAIIASAFIGLGLTTVSYIEKYKEPGIADLSAASPTIINSAEELEELIAKTATEDLPKTVEGEASAKNKNPEKQSIKPMNREHLVTIETDLGNIQFVTYDVDAPNTVKNFITLAEKGFYNRVLFHRVIDGFMIQGGDPTGTGMGGPGYAFADELNPETDSYKEGYKKGVVAMANSGPDTNGSQFFIMVADVPLPKNYTIFGRVVSGQEVADRISQVPRDKRNGDRPLEPVWMNKVTITENISN